MAFREWQMPVVGCQWAAGGLVGVGGWTCDLCTWLGLCASLSSEGGGGVMLAPCVRRRAKGLHSACRGSFTRPYVPLVVYKLIHLRHGDPQPEASAAVSAAFEARAR